MTSSVNLGIYEGRVKTLLNKKKGATWEEITKDADTYHKYVSQYYENHSTRSMYMNLPMALLKQGSKYVEGWSDEKLESFRKNSDKALLKRNEVNEEKQETETYVDYDKLKEEVKKKSKSAETRLIYTLYFTQPPIRDDYTQMHVVDKVKDAADIANNYYIRSISTFILNNYKTKATYGQAAFKASPEARAAIKAYTKQMDTNILFPNIKSLTRRFKNYTGGYTITDVRHSYISTFLKTNPTPSQKKALAERMLHSTNLQAQYERFKKDDSESDEPGRLD
jgi:hypothetical protein